MALTGENKTMFEAIIKRLEQSENRLLGEIKEIKEANGILAKKYDDLEKRLESQNETILQLQRQVNSNNLIIFGIKENEEEDNVEDSVMVMIKSKLQVDMRDGEIDQLYRLGKKQANRIRPIKVCFASNGAKSKILKNRTKLAGTDIYVNEDLPKALRIRESEKRKQRMESGEKAANKRLVPTSFEEDDEAANAASQNTKKLNLQSRAPTIRYWLNMRDTEQKN